MAHSHLTSSFLKLSFQSPLFATPSGLFCSPFWVVLNQFEIFFDYFGWKLQDTRSWRVSDMEGFDMNTEEDSKDGVVKFFQTRDKKKRKNSLFGTYTLMIHQWLRFFSSWKATKHLFGCLCLAPRKRSRSSHFQLIRLGLRRCNTQPCCILWTEYNLDSIKGRQMWYENNPQ